MDVQEDGFEIDQHVVSNSAVFDVFDDPKRIADIAAALRDEGSKQSLRAWVGSDRATLVVVFTDIIDSTRIGQELGDEKWRTVRLAHFSRSRSLILKYQGHEIKTIGDSFMLVFKSVGAAIDYGLDLYEDSGNSTIRVRVGIHIGALDVEDDDIFGGQVNYAARVIGMIQGAEIWVSDAVKKKIDEADTRAYRTLKWTKHDAMKLKGFDGHSILWSMELV